MLYWVYLWQVFATRYSHPASIRGQFGLTDTRNSSHGSDSDATAAAEIKFFFPEFDQRQWEQEERARFSVTDSVIFDPDNFVHRLADKKNS